MMGERPVIGHSPYAAGEKYHSKVPEVTRIRIADLKRLNAMEIADVSDDVASAMDLTEPIQVSVFADGEMRIVDGHHRVAAARKRGIEFLPVELQAINAKGDTINFLIRESNQSDPNSIPDQPANQTETETLEKWFGAQIVLDGSVALPGVVADVVGVRDGPIAVYSWSGDGTGRTRAALRLLADFGNGDIEVHDPGEVGTESRKYWEKMLGEGLVSRLVDACGNAATPDIGRSQRHQADTPEFKKWFGDSKVVDSDGKPLVVYRGDREGKTEFTGKVPGSRIQSNVFFTDRKSIGDRYARGGELYPVFLSLQNPYEVDAEGNSWIDVPAPDAIKAEWGNPDKTIQIDDLAEWAREQGHDGLIVRDVVDQFGGGDQFVAFRPEQIKSAIGNSGKFNPDSASLTDHEPPADEILRPLMRG